MNADWPLLSEVLILALRAKVVVKVVEASEEQRVQKCSPIVQKSSKNVCRFIDS